MVIIGAGFDTRSIRYQREGLRFFEVDLPETIDAKRCVHERYRDEVNPQVNLPTLVGMDLNDCEHSSLLAHLEEGYGLKNPSSDPTPDPNPDPTPADPTPADPTPDPNPDP